MKKLIEVIKNMSAQLNVWVAESRAGGWSTRQVEPMLKKSSDLAVAALEAERRLPKWQHDISKDGHYWIRYRAYITDNGPKGLATEFTTDLVYADIDDDGDIYICSARLGPDELCTDEVGEDFMFSGPLMAPAPPVYEEDDV